MRKRMKCSSVIALLAVGLVGVSCGGNGGPGSEAGENNAKLQDVEGAAVLRVRMKTDPPSIDPAHGTDTSSAFLQECIFDGLVQLDPVTLEVVPAVAKSWEIFDGGRGYTFHLRKGVKFHNGREVTSEDFRYSFERLVNRKTRAERAWVVSMLSGSADFASGKSLNISGIETPDPYTVILKIDEPSAIFLPQLTMANAGAVPKEEAEKWGEEFTAHPMGCGPFKFVSWRSDIDVVLEAFGDYYDGKPAIPKVEFRILPDDSVAYSEYKTGGLDLLNPLPNGRLRDIQAELPGEVDLVPTLGTYFLSFNLEHEPFKGNKKLRQAFNYAINKKAICEVLEEGRCVPATGVLPPGMPGHNPELVGYPYDLEKAKSLLAEAGYPGGEGLPEITLWYNTSQGHQAICVNIQAELKKIGVRIKLKNIEWAAYLKAVEAGEPSFFRLAWIADIPDPDNFLYTKFHSRMIAEEGNDNDSRYRNPEFDALIDKARALTDFDERVKLYQQAEKLIVEDAPWVFVYFYGEAILLKPRVKGFVHSPQGYFATPLHKMWIE
ncbi:ABC transporter substrate-binding protein [Candidatus Hydrogenedentota bacterium]